MCLVLDSCPSKDVYAHQESHGGLVASPTWKAATAYCFARGCDPGHNSFMGGVCAPILARSGVSPCEYKNTYQSINGTLDRDQGVFHCFH